MKPKNAMGAPQEVITKVLYKTGALKMSTNSTEHFNLTEVDRLEVLSLVDNSIDFLSVIGKEEAQSFRQWTAKKYGQEWNKVHSQFPIAEHGFSMLVRVTSNGKQTSFLFDTGVSPDGVVENAKRMGLELGEVACIILSHGHYDHFGGLVSALKTINNPNLPLIVHEDMFRTRGTTSRDGTIRTYPEFPKREQLSLAKVISTEQPRLIADGKILVTGEIPRETSFEKGFPEHRILTNGVWQPDSYILDDRAIVANIKGKGLIVLSGCAHAGIINTIKYAQKITGITDVFAIMGGFHLAGKENENKIEQTITELKRINSKLIVPCHCTGSKAIFAIANALPDKFVYNSVGNLYSIY